MLQTPAIETATGDVVMVERNVDASEAAQIMLEKSVGTMPVLENEKLVGMITERDFFSWSHDECIRGLIGFSSLKVWMLASRHSPQ
ncbi:MAG: CBS domain-containing protein [Candidatus Bathyarchaeota archaeon]